MTDVQINTVTFSNTGGCCMHGYHYLPVFSCPICLRSSSSDVTASAASISVTCQHGYTDTVAPVRHCPVCSPVTTLAAAPARGFRFSPVACEHCFCCDEGTKVVISGSYDARVPKGHVQCCNCGIRRKKD